MEKDMFSTKKDRLPKLLIFIFLFIAVVYLNGCKNSPPATTQSKNPPQPGFDLANSDAKAIEIADKVMEACGGWKNWENTRYITWRALGKRLNVWDKWTGDIRIESRRSLILMNLHTMKGHAWKGLQEITDAEALKRAMEYGYEAWLHDSYWLFLPFKLKDAGVTLKYIGEGKTDDDRPVDILALTFKNVGQNPRNKYIIYVEKASHLLTQWAYFMDASDKYPRFTTPWANYQKYGNILLSDDRGEKKHKDIAVFNKLPRSVFEAPVPIDWEKITNDQ